MTALQTSFKEVQEFYPGTAEEIYAMLEKKMWRDYRFAPRARRMKWFYIFLPRKSRDNRGPNDIRFGIYATHDRWKHRIDKWQALDPQSVDLVPPTLEYFVTLQSEGVRHHNTSHEAVISWHNPTQDRMVDYLVSAGVEMPNGTVRIAIVWVGAPIILRDPATFKRPYMWVEATEDGISLPNDIPPRLSDIVFAANPGEEISFAGDKMRRLTQEELKRFGGMAYEGRQRVKAIASP